MAAVALITLGAAYECAIRSECLAKNPTRGLEQFLTLRWDFVDWRKGCLRFPEPKTGGKVVPLADQAIAILNRRWEETRPPDASRGHNSGEAIVHPGVNSPWVLPAPKH